jgi:light-harvesting complex 1 beta chain
MRRTTPMSWRCAADTQVARVGRNAGLRALLKRSIRMATRTSISGLTDEEAQEFHQYYIQGFIGFTAIAVVAHILVWFWRPWL